MIYEKRNLEVGDNVAAGRETRHGGLVRKITGVVTNINGFGHIRVESSDGTTRTFYKNLTEKNPPWPPAVTFLLDVEWFNTQENKGA